VAPRTRGCRCKVRSQGTDCSAACNETRGCVPVLWGGGGLGKGVRLLCGWRGRVREGGTSARIHDEDLYLGTATHSSCSCESATHTTGGQAY